MLCWSALDLGGAMRFWASSPEKEQPGQHRQNSTASVKSSARRAMVRPPFPISDTSIAYPGKKS